MWSGATQGWGTAVRLDVSADSLTRKCGRACWSFRELFGVFFCSPLVVAAVLQGLGVIGVGRVLEVAGVVFVLMGVAALIPTYRGWLVTWWRESRRRYYRHRLKATWPEICRVLGWYRDYGKDGLGRPQMLVATLRGLRFERDGQVLVVEVKPLPNQPRTHWGVMTDQLRRYLGVPVARWDEPAPGILRMALSAVPLPTLVDYPALTSWRWDVLPVGVRAGSDMVAWRPSETPHLLVGGATKGGKGSAIRAVAYGALRSGWQLHVVNPKLSGEFRWLEALGVPVVETLAQVLEVVEGFERERERRQAIVKAAGVGSWEQVPGWADPPQLLIVDEVSALLMVDKANKEVAKLQERISYVVTRLVQMGRSAGIHLVLATQRPDVSTLGPNGGILRDNVDGRLGVCSLQDAGVAMLFGTGLDPDIKSTLDGTKGRALATMLSAGDFDTYPLQLFWLDEGVLTHAPPRPAVPQLGVATVVSTPTGSREVLRPEVIMPPADAG